MLRIEGLSKTYANGVKALSGVDLDIPRGMFGLLGPNGAGKSTLMRTIATLQEADQGSILFDGIDVLRDKDALRRTLGYLPQEFGVYPRVTAQDLLDHLAVLKGIARAGERKAVVEGLLRQTNLWEVRQRNLGTYSGGMRQRFGIAQALLGNPKLIIVDEPTAGLDPEERQRFLNLLSEIGENVVVILSTHIVEDVSDLCSRMAILARGRVLVSGEPREVVSSLAGKVWRKVVAKSEVADWQSKTNVLSTRLFGGRTLLHAASESAPGEGFEAAEPDLEDVYFFHLKHAGQVAAGSPS